MASYFDKNSYLGDILLKFFFAQKDCALPFLLCIIKQEIIDIKIKRVS